MLQPRSVADDLGRGAGTVRPASGLEPARGSYCAPAVASRVADDQHAGPEERQPAAAWGLAVTVTGVVDRCVMAQRCCETDLLRRIATTRAILGGKPIIKEPAARSRARPPHDGGWGHAPRLCCKATPGWNLRTLARAWPSPDASSDTNALNRRLSTSRDREGSALRMCVGRGHATGPGIWHSRRRQSALAASQRQLDTTTVGSWSAPYHLGGPRWYVRR